MASMTFSRSQDNRDMIILENHFLRYIFLFFRRAASTISGRDYEEKFQALDRSMTHSSSGKRRYKILSRLAYLISRFIIEVKPVMDPRSILNIPGLREFCQRLRFHPWLRTQWEPLILSCTRESWSTWAEKQADGLSCTILKIATVQWEFGCFRHYRETFRHWAFTGHPCKKCALKLLQMARNVEYDSPSIAWANYNPAGTFLNCLDAPPTQLRTSGTPSLAPFIMVLKLPKNVAWLEWWAPFIHKHIGFTVPQLYRAFLATTRRRDEAQGVISSPNRIGNTMFEYRHLGRMVDSVRRERANIHSGLEALETLLSEEMGNYAADHL